MSCSSCHTILLYKINATKLNILENIYEGAFELKSNRKIYYTEQDDIKTRNQTISFENRLWLIIELFKNKYIPFSRKFSEV